MKVFDAAAVASALPYGDLIEALRQGFRAPCETPVRHHHAIPGNATLLLMPAWTAQWTGIKTITVKPDNPAQGLSAVTGSYLLFDNATGAPVAIMDGTELTRRRTAAASALAADYLARKDAAVHTIVGAGALAPHFARAHGIKTVNLWNRTPSKAEAVAAELRLKGINAQAVPDLEKAIGGSDIVSCVTGSDHALVKGEWLRLGTHLDLAGAYTPSMREVDAEAVRRARVYVDTREGALHEAGDLLQAKFDFATLAGDLSELCGGKVKGRASAEEITLFKSCGTALEDLASAVLVHLRG